MAQHVPGIAITIKAFLPTGKTLDEQFTALSLVKGAHASGDYSAVLKAAKIDEVKAEQKTRRVEDAPTTESGKTEEQQTDIEDFTSSGETDPDYIDPAEPSEEDVPAFLKKKKTA